MAENEEPNDTPIELNESEQAFVTAYFEENMNATRAYLKLHPKVKYESARAASSAFLTNLNVKAAIKQTLTERAMSAEEAVYRLGEIARAEFKPFIRIDKDGFVYFNFADPDALRCLYLIKKIKTKRERRLEGQGEDAEEWEGEWVEVELHDAHAALRDILKMHGKFVDKVDLSSGGKPLADENAIYDRVLAKITRRMESNDAAAAEGVTAKPE